MSDRAPAAASCALAVGLAGCGGAAPGEAMDHPPMPAVAPEVVTAQQALGRPDLRRVDPAPLDRAEADKLLPPGPRCSFTYTSASPPILLVAAAPSGAVRGIIKIHGRLVELSGGNAGLPVHGGRFAADGLSLQIKPAELPAAAPADASRTADAVFEIEQGLHVGYRGGWHCDVG